MLYIAYGSNLHLEQMARRCPTATVVDAAEMKGYDLRFRGGLATVEPQDSGAVPVLLWEIGGRDLAALDRYEGWPSLYRKENALVEVDGEPVEVMVYIMNEEQAGYQPPGYGYYHTIREGYESAGFDTAYLDAAVEHSRQLMLEQAAPQPEMGL